MTRVQERPFRNEERHRPADPYAPRSRALDVLFGPRAEDAIRAEFATARALLAAPYGPDPDGLTDPMPALLAESEHIVASRNAACRTRFDEDRRRREDIAAAAWIDAAVGAEMAATAAAVHALAPAVLAASTAPALTDLRAALTDLDELLAPPLPGTYWLLDLRAVLPVAVAQPKGPVA